MSTAVIELAMRLFKLLSKNVCGTRERIPEIIKHIPVGNTRNTSEVYKYTRKIPIKM
jgi:hypothetical protein